MRAPSTTIIMPFRADSKERQRNLEFTQAYWKHRVPEANVIVADSGDKPFNKCRTINETFKNAPRSECTIMADVDCFTTDRAIKEALERFWGRVLLPHRWICYLNPTRTEDVLKCYKPTDRIGGRIYRKQRSKLGAVGGIWVIDSEILEANPMNELFEGWGNEDEEFLLRVPHERLQSPLYHLYHPKQWNHPDNDKMNYAKSRALVEKTRNEYHASQRNLLNGQGAGSPEAAS